jgi:hypothetical protein
MNYEKAKGLVKERFIHALMFSDKEDMLKVKFLHHLAMNDYNFFLDVNSYLQNYIFEEYIEDSIKMRIESLVRLCISNTDDKEMLHILNRLLDDCKLMSGKNAGLFYRRELATRKNNTKYLSISDTDLELVKPDLFKSLATDYDVVKTHGPAVSEEEFKEKYLEHFANSMHYLESVRALLPHIDKDNRYTFNNKVLMVTNYNSKHVLLNLEGVSLATQSISLKHKIVKG